VVGGAKPARRIPNGKAEPATFVRHYEDAANTIAAASRLPPLTDHGHVQALAAEMLVKKQIAAMPSFSNPSLAPSNGPRWNEIRRAQVSIDPRFWGPRIPLEEACATMRAWARATFSLD
jgi:hypothetical protein